MIMPRTPLLVKLVVVLTTAICPRGLSVWAFIPGSMPENARKWQQSRSRTHHYDHRENCNPFQLSMVRNIDLPECIVFYGDGLLAELRDDDGLRSLLEECQDTDTAVIALVDAANEKDREAITHLSESLKGTAIVTRPVTQDAPNPRDLWEAIQSITVQPRPFGRSAGFGSKLPDPERCPLPARTVVLCQTVDETRAARYCGMRVLCFTDNDLADAILDLYDYKTIDFYLDDIATPGSFWLNPPHPRDDDGNKVGDMETLIQRFEQQGSGDVAGNERSVDGGNEGGSSSYNNPDELGDSEIDRILADLAPL